MDNILKLISIAAIIFYMMCALKYQLQMLQQSSYRNKRYLAWLKSTIGWHLYGYGVLVAMLLFISEIVGFTILSLVLVVMGIRILNRKSKKPLVFTARVVRIYSVSVALALSVPLYIFISTDNFFLPSKIFIGISLLSFLVVILANIILMPVERAINDWYIADARRILASMPDLKIIGITGSYGKTSTKHFLYRLLSEKYNTLMTPGSYNTTLGVVRTIREKLKPYHDVFIVEMGAKEIGDIAEICDIVHPSIGILTSIGEQHLESFRNIENIKKTKFELIDSLPSKGLAVLNNDFKHIATQPVENVRNIIRYGVKNNANIHLEEVNYGKEGSHFTIKDNKNGNIVKLTTPILGSYNISNIMASYAVASYLGVEPSKIAGAVERLESVEHRLQVRHAAGGITIIDDAFNSNPEGAAMALDVLCGFAPSIRILVTPGMVELGEKQYTYNKEFGAKAAACADYVVIVGKYNSEAIKEGLVEAGYSEDKIYDAVTLNEGVKHISAKFANKGYVVLYENDLPDTFK